MSRVAFAEGVNVGRLIFIPQLALGQVSLAKFPSRSLGTELSKITAANISAGDKKLILGENYRTLLHPILKTKKP